MNLRGANRIIGKRKDNYPFSCNALRECVNALAWLAVFRESVLDNDCNYFVG